MESKKLITHEAESVSHWVWDNGTGPFTVRSDHSQEYWERQQWVVFRLLVNSYIESFC